MHVVVSVETIHDFAAEKVMMNRIIFTSLFILLFQVGGRAQTCTANGCDLLVPGDLSLQVSLWNDSGFDCNDDSHHNLLDLVCLLNIVPDFDAPVFLEIGPQTVIVAESLTFTLQATDPNGDPLSFSAQDLPKNASLDTSSGVFTFSPALTQAGIYEVRFMVSDGFLEDYQDVSITVTSPIIAIDQDLNTQEDTSLGIILTANNAMGGVTFQLVDPPDFGLVSGQSPNLTYLPESNYAGSDSFTFTATDDLGAGSPGTIRIQVHPVNDPPVAQDMEMVTGVDMPIDITLHAEDVENGSLSYEIMDPPVNGTLAGTPPEVIYTPTAGYGGDDNFRFRANDGEIDGDPGTVSIRVALPAPVLDPHDTLVNGSPVTLTGMVPAGDSIEISGPEGNFTVPVTGGRFTADIPVKQNAINKIFANAVMGSLRGPPATTAITHDNQPPSLSILFPESGALLTTTTTDVAGTVGDTLGGSLGLEVTVNGMSATVDVGTGSMGTFFLPDVVLDPNALNLIQVVAADEMGNTATRNLTLSHRLVAAGVPLMTRVSGNAQSGDVGTVLSQPLVVGLDKHDGSPFPNKVVTFEIIRSDGQLSIDGSEAGRLVYQVRTDADGLAQAVWRLGRDAGFGNNRIRVTSAGVSGSIFFCASANVAGGTQINIGSGNSQRIEAGAPAGEPLAAWVNDGLNGVPNVPVTFTVLAGTGTIDGQTQVVVPTGATGHAEVPFILGREPGNNVIAADFPGNTTGPAKFTLLGLFPDQRLTTDFSGLVIDNSNRGIAGAECRLVVRGVDQGTVLSREDGSFSFHGIEDGSADLYVNGTVATGVGGVDVLPGSFPETHFDPIIVPNTVNSLPVPIHLPFLNPLNGVRFDNTRDVVLEVEGIEGLSMLVKAGSMTRADGSVPTAFDPAIISLNPVHADHLPMSLPNGAAPPIAWTLQPANAAFDPPIQVTYSNSSGLEPGALAFFLSFNQSTNNFQIVASGCVTRDGSSIITDSGSGISQAGLGGSCPPYPVTGVVKND